MNSVQILQVQLVQYLMYTNIWIVFMCFRFLWFKFCKDLIDLSVNLSVNLQRMSSPISFWAMNFLLESPSLKNTCVLSVFANCNLQTEFQVARSFSRTNEKMENILAKGPFPIKKKKQNNKMTNKISLIPETLFLDAWHKTDKKGEHVSDVGIFTDRNRLLQSY